MVIRYRNRLLISSVSFKINGGDVSKEDVKFFFALCRPYGYTEYGRDDIDFNKRQEVLDMFNKYYLNTSHLYSSLADVGMELMVDCPIDQDNVNVGVVELSISNAKLESHLDYSWIILYMSMSDLIYPIEIIRASEEGECVSSPSSIDFNLQLKL